MVFPVDVNGNEQVLARRYPVLFEPINVSDRLRARVVLFSERGERLAFPDFMPFPLDLLLRRDGGVVRKECLFLAKGDSQSVFGITAEELPTV